MTKHKSIAVDGPSGAGKSTLAKLLARRLGFLYVDTGAIYRTVGLRAYRAGVDPEDEAAVTALLDGLAQRGVKATFFLIGAQLEHNEDLIRRMDAEGHQIGIHTYDHVALTGLSKADFDAQVALTRQKLMAILGHDGFLLRPPYGAVDDAVRKNAGCPIILWSIDPEDWGDQNAAREIEHVVANAQDGSIILLHDIFPPSVEAALAIVDRLHAQGYLFVTVEELFAARHITLEAGEVYRDAYP